METDFPLTTLYEETTGTSFQDGLTGLFNHGFFQLILDREIKRSERQGKPFTLALIDVGRFSRYNLKHGYPSGDRLLKEVAVLLTENIRTIDWAGPVWRRCVRLAAGRRFGRRGPKRCRADSIRFQTAVRRSA